MPVGLGLKIPTSILLELQKRRIKLVCFVLLQNKLFSIVVASHQTSCEMLAKISSYHLSTQHTTYSMYGSRRKY